MDTSYRLAAAMFFRFFLQLTINAFFYLCYACVNTLDCIFAKLTLTNRRQLSTEFARQSRILWRQKLSEGNETSPMDFLCAFSYPIIPEYVLRPIVSLYAITDKVAVFVETPETVNIYSSDVHPFFYIAQFLYAKNVIKMSIKNFMTLAEYIGDPAVPIIWMSTTGRCGGTMLSQVFESLPGTLVIHEPYSPQNLYNLFEYRKLHVSEYEDLLKALIRVLCKPYQGVNRICIKPRPKCTIMMTDISKLQEMQGDNCILVSHVCVFALRVCDILLY